MKNYKKEVVDRICRALNKTMEGLASDLGVTKSAISSWKTSGIPAERCKHLESLVKDSSDPITCIDMRPNDWQKYWPELEKSIDANGREIS